jgi:hypothetical protein
MANTRPATPLPTFATDANYTSGPDNTLATKVAMLSGEQAQGFFRTGRAAARKVNWLLNKIGAWIDWLQQHTLDGENGGAWNPDAFITIGGAGLKLTTVLRFDSGASAGEISFQGSATSFIVNTADASFSCKAFFNASDAARFNGTVLFTDIATFQVAPIFQAGGNLHGGFINDTPGLLVSPSGTIIGTGSGTFDLQAPATVSAEMVLSGAGRIRKRLTYAPNSNVNFDVTTTDVLVLQLGLSGPPNIYTLQNAGASEGSIIEVWNYSGAAHIIHDSGGAGLATMATASSGEPGRAKFCWLNDGITTKWKIVSLEAP